MRCGGGGGDGLREKSTSSDSGIILLWPAYIRRARSAEFEFGGRAADAKPSDLTGGWVSTPAMQLDMILQCAFACRRELWGGGSSNSRRIAKLPPLKPLVGSATWELSCLASDCSLSRQWPWLQAYKSVEIRAFCA